MACAHNFSFITTGVHPSEAELYQLILGALPHSPWNPLPWLFSSIIAATVCFAPGIHTQRPPARMMAVLLFGGAAFAIMSYYSDRASERDAHMLATIISQGNYRVFVVDEGEEIEVRGRAGAQVYLGITHAEKISNILEKHEFPVLYGLHTYRSSHQPF